MTTRQKALIEAAVIEGQWTEAYEEWQRGEACSPSTSDLLAYAERILGRRSAITEDALFDMDCDGASLRRMALAVIG